MDHEIEAFLAAQDAAVNGLTIAAFLGNLRAFRERAGQSPRVELEHRAQLVRDARIAQLVEHVDVDEASAIAGRELAEVVALVGDPDAAGRWPEESPYARVAAGTAEQARQIPEQFWDDIRLNVRLVPGGSA